MPNCDTSCFLSGISQGHLAGQQLQSYEPMMGLLAWNASPVAVLPLSRWQLQLLLSGDWLQSALAELCPDQGRQATMTPAAVHCCRVVLHTLSD